MSTIICVVIGAAPVTDSRSVERSNWSRSGWLRIVWKMAGGPGSIVMRFLRDPAHHRRHVEHRVRHDRRALRGAQARMPAFNPNAWKNGLTMR